MAKIRVEGITKIFGPHPKRGLEMLDQGKSNADIRETGHAVGCADVSFEVAEGEFLVVMGLSGSGKSTLIRCLNLLNKPTRGHIYIDGEDITRYDARRTAEAAPAQDQHGLPALRAVSASHRGRQRRLRPGDPGRGSDERRREANEALELVGLKGWCGFLSRTAQRRHAAARRAWPARWPCGPDILLMDEAFSALDPLIRRDMQHEMISLQQRMKKTIVFITHDLDEALQVGDRIVLMKDGRVVQIGTPEDILNNPANAYVERFVENVDMSRVLTARSVMTPGTRRRLPRRWSAHGAAQDARRGRRQPAGGQARLHAAAAPSASTRPTRRAKEGLGLDRVPDRGNTLGQWRPRP